MNTKILLNLIDEMISEAEKLKNKKAVSRILELNKKFREELR